MGLGVVCMIVVLLDLIFCVSLDFGFLGYFTFLGFDWLVCAYGKLLLLRGISWISGTPMFLFSRVGIIQTSYFGHFTVLCCGCLRCFPSV